MVIANNANIFLTCGKPHFTGLSIYKLRNH